MPATEDRPADLRWIPEAIQKEKGYSPSLTLIALTMRTESDRGCTVLGSEVANTELESLLRNFCVRDPESIKTILDPLFTGYAPLNSFSAKIDMCYVLYLISGKLRRDLHLIRKLRNQFAHEPGTITFETPKCNGRLQLLLGLPGLTNLGATEEAHAMLRQLQTKDPADFRRTAFVFKIIEIAGSIAATRAWMSENPGSRPCLPPNSAPKKSPSETQEDTMTTPKLQVRPTGSTVDPSKPALEDSHEFKYMVEIEGQPGSAFTVLLKATDKASARPSPEACIERWLREAGPLPAPGEIKAVPQGTFGHNF